MVGRLGRSRRSSRQLGEWAWWRSGRRKAHRTSASASSPASTSANEEAGSALRLPQLEHVVHERVVILLADDVAEGGHPGPRPEGRCLLGPQLQGVADRIVLSGLSQVANSDAIVSVAGD